MSPTLQPAHAHSERAQPEVIMHTLTDAGVFPNNAKLPLTVYRGAVALPEHNPAAEFEALFAAHDWPPAWRYGIFGYHHYHSTAHEVLGIFRGRATIQFGGEQGVVLEVQAGDVVVIPAGVAHKSLGSSRNFCAVG
ncbi:MAG: cupin domain-containing protein, partial [Candidatus Tectomicrobia bacterium]|nr:cupin domain-containing protein [Candidatus Tectomicrobia bacterium]